MRILAHQSIGRWSPVHLQGAHSRNAVDCQGLVTNGAATLSGKSRPRLKKSVVWYKCSIKAKCAE
jgi:hypothetical protein